MKDYSELARDFLPVFDLILSKSYDEAREELKRLSTKHAEAGRETVEYAHQVGEILKASESGQSPRDIIQRMKRPGLPLSYLKATADFEIYCYDWLKESRIIR